ncbi:MAG: 2-amino-4-hydroxy-6-hydroxymethyldihydropteridine diphosphokinase, partial [Anaerolineales bacterium]|nr:2-amino-4-hydroxy-6-hydroxymethyldihydropteridine diphosphokinase [Anaerolineales bacterium]
SNIEPEKNILQAIKLLKENGEVESISSVWESESVGYAGANFLNLCVLFLTDLQPDELKETVIRPIENELGRVRDENKNAPRSIDIDIVLFNETLYHVNTWKYAFVIVPLAELIPDFVHPFEKKSLIKVSDDIQNQVWIEKREDVIVST